MAETTEKKTQTQSGGQQGSQQRQSGQSSGEMQTRGQGQRGGLSRRGFFAPSMFALSPSAMLGMSPFDLMRRFTDELDRAFEGFGLSRAPEFGITEAAMWSPAVEVFERDNNLIVRAELPGLSSDDVNIELTDDGLVIRGERRSEHEEQREGYYRSEINYGRFYRLIPVPEGANVDQAQAQMENGVLEITVPMAEARQRRRSIPIGTGGRSAQAAGGQSQTATGGSGKK